MITTRSAGARLGGLALGIGLLWAGAAGAAPLSWKFKPGEVLRYESDQTTVSKVKDPNGQEASQTLTLTMDLTWTVKEVDPQGVASLTQTIDRIKTSMTLPGGKIAFDSKDNSDPNSPAAPLFKLLVGAEFAFRMNPKGELSDIKLSDQLTKSLAGEGEAGAPSRFSEAGLKNMLTQMGMILPGTDTDPSKPWGRKLSIPSGPNGQSLEVEQTYTDKGADPAGKPLEVIEMVTKFAPLKLDEKIPVTIKSQEATGRFLFDNAAGRIDSSRITERVELAREGPGQGDRPEQRDRHPDDPPPRQDPLIVARTRVEACQIAGNSGC